MLALNVSADVMLFDWDERGPDEDLRLHFEAVSNLDPDEKSIIKELIEVMLLKHDAKRWTQRPGNSERVGLQNSSRGK